MTPETCSLAWKPPLDDGGSPITNYIVEKLEASSGVSNIPSRYFVISELVVTLRVFFRSGLSSAVL